MLGIGLIVVSWGSLYRVGKRIKGFDFTETGKQLWLKTKMFPSKLRIYRRHIVEDFSEPIKAISGKSFGKDDQLTFELFRNGTFLIDGKSGYAWQKSDSYRDSAFIRSTKALPETYKISVIVGGIDYGLENILGLSQDPEYSEGPQNENGFYFLAITDTPPIRHHTNTWWHQHRKLVIDVDNNVWGHGMPNPIFMVYFNKDNKLVSYDGKNNEWGNDWMKGVTYESDKYYKIAIEKTKKQYILSVRSEDDKLLKTASVVLEKVWNADEYHKDYFVIGDPHENYYQGSMKIKEISIRY